MANTFSGSHFALREMIKLGWPILSVLLVFSIVSLAIMWDRWWAIRRARKSMPRVINDIVLRLTHAGSADNQQRLLALETARFIVPLEERLAILGTIASTAPFVGLLGTVIGIIRAFRAVSVSMGGGHAVVASGISEALIATAIGLMVAIPAVMGFNYFNSKLRALEQRFEISVGELLWGKK
ncbi:MAG: MotA/TolQ/ExbB proton channel family protein [Elusimicrobiota bacterium]